MFKRNSGRNTINDDQLLHDFQVALAKRRDKYQGTVLENTMMTEMLQQTKIQVDILTDSVSNARKNRQSQLAGTDRGSALPEALSKRDLSMASKGEVFREDLSTSSGVDKDKLHGKKLSSTVENLADSSYEKRYYETRDKLAIMVNEARSKQKELEELKLKAAKMQAFQVEGKGFCESLTGSLIIESSVQDKLSLLRRISQELQVKGFVSARATELLQLLDVKDDSQWMFENKAQESQKKHAHDMAVNTDEATDWESKAIKLEDELEKAREELQIKQLNLTEKCRRDRNQEIEMDALLRIAITEALTTEQLLLSQAPGSPQFYETTNSNDEGFVIKQENPESPLFSLHC